MEKFSLAGVIVLPEVRYISTSRQMFHTRRIEAQDRDGNIRRICECENVDCSGYCTGHYIGRKQFIDTYCNGEPPKEFLL